MFGPAVASLLATILVFTVFLGLVASTIGDSTDLGEGLGLLLFLFAMIAVCGFVLGFLQSRKNKSKIDINGNEGSLDP
jgi:NhaP-type Na+/H+ or K+/H+ antiporter|tara:strand:- start:291 stop:524 length:234 start_codon:yes stop_codon:yes gene_type:complete